MLAAGGAYLLRERGVRGTSSTGTLAAADPLIAAVPALAGIAAGLTAIRLVPLPLRVLSRIAARSRGLVPLLALRRAIHGGTTAAVLVVLLATASIGAFSSAALVHLERASTAASWHEVGAPIRVTSQVGALPVGFDPSTLPGVRHERDVVQGRDPGRDAQPPDPAARGRPRGLRADRRGHAGRPTLPARDARRPDVPDGVVPLLVSSGAARTHGRRPAPRPVRGRRRGLPLPGAGDRIASRRSRHWRPTRSSRSPRGPSSGPSTRRPQLAPIIAFVDAPEAEIGAIRDGRDERRDRGDGREPGGVRPGLHRLAGHGRDRGRDLVAASIAGLYAALAVAAALALAGPSRATEVAQLRMMGLSRGDGLGLVGRRARPEVLLAFIAGVALGPRACSSCSSRVSGSTRSSARGRGAAQRRSAAARDHRSPGRSRSPWCGIGLARLDAARRSGRGGLSTRVRVGSPMNRRGAG